jgi:hypothetical protein
MGALLDLAMQAGTPPQPATADERARQQRIDQAVRMLREAPKRHAAFIAGPLVDGLVPVTVVIRTAQGMVTGDLEIPGDRWEPGLFLKFLQEQDFGRPS